VILAFIELAGGVCELLGALMMANALLGIVQPGEVWKYLGSALFKGNLGTTAFQRVSGLTPENHALSLRGLAFIVVGFVVKVILIAIKIAADFAPATTVTH
jgi:hypothetical protein